MASAAQPLAVARAAKSAWFSLQSRRRGRSPRRARRRRLGQPERVGEPGDGCPRSLGAVPESAPLRALSRFPSELPLTMGIDRSQSSSATAADPIAASPVYPAGSRVNERGHLEIAGCDLVEPTVRHPGLYLLRGRHPRSGTEVPARLRGTHRCLRGDLREQGASRHRRVPRDPRGGPSWSTSPGASCTWPWLPASIRRGSTCTATTRPRRSSAAPSRRASGT